MQAWSFASETNDELLLSAIPSVLTTLLQTLSNILEFSEYGLQMCRTLLLKKQQELIARGLTSNPHKAPLIGPALRLLREIVKFDGGVLARQVFKARDQTLKSLARNLGIRSKDTVEDPKKPSVRTTAARFVLSLMKFLPAEAKRDLLNQRDIVGALTKDIKDDPPHLVREILEGLKSSVMLDAAVPREAKSRIINITSLSRICMLYRYEKAKDLADGHNSIEDVAHEFLKLACTSPNAGVLVRQAGFYPRGIDPEDTHEEDSMGSYIDLGLDSIDWMDSFTEKVPVRNTALSEFIQNLRPWANNKQGELLLGIFKAAPELVADYFYAKKDFSFDPKLTATWMGYAAFIYSALELPPPQYFGFSGKYARLPPPPAIIMESLLPQPLSQKVLTRCLTLPNNNLISFFAIRILCIAFSKLQKILKMYREAATGASIIWTQASNELVEDFCQRCPQIKDVIVAFRRMTNTDLMQREAATKLLVLYYEIVPRIALEAKFGVSTSLAESLQAMEDLTLTSQERILRAMELENLFTFAHLSPGMRWFSKAEGLSVSPFMAMLQLYVDAPSGLPLLKLRSVLEAVAEENQIFQTRTNISALESFVYRLREIKGSQSSSIIHNFLDDCISRCSSKPVKYIFSLEELRPEVETEDKSSSISLLTLVMAEQWPFLLKSIEASEALELASFTARYLAASTKIGEDKKVLKKLVKKLVEETSTNPAAQKILEKSRKLVDEIGLSEPKPMSIVETFNKDNNSSVEEEKSTLLASLSDKVDDPVENHRALTKWTTKEVDEVIEEGHAAALIMLLSSEHLSVRKEAATNISKFAMKLKESSFEEREQIWLLLLEVVETAKLVIDQGPLLTVIVAFASRAIGVLKDPLHCLYVKMNNLLAAGPTWKLDRIPLMHKVFSEQPTLDDGHYAELHWLLSVLLVGLRTPADMSMYRNKRVFENLLSLYNSTNLPNGIREKIIRIIYKASNIEGGSNTLITRFSTMTWLQAQTALGGGATLKLLMERILESCDKKRIKVWSRGAGKVKEDMGKFRGAK